MKKRKKETQENWIRTQLRLPPYLYIGLSEYARKNNISMNKSILRFVENGTQEFISNRDEKSTVINKRGKPYE